ncbi:MAG: hypothetical protein GTN53_06065 [Candidatus Aminicenantes bacterium]|nr:hypothetical protein [Candidatus Aminicenantes bacterium]NIQ66061.1 hypothetical protein [Candidatus Aminicenantes bacterium]NIT22054.1 hypothetical protein [Candidatus Aminicenantes bacterium]
MKVQYIYNEDGERESVIIPYKEWERIRSSINEEEDTDFDPDKYKGIYKGLQIDLEEEIKDLRDEWNRFNT